MFDAILPTRLEIQDPAERLDKLPPTRRELRLDSRAQIGHQTLRSKALVAIAISQSLSSTYLTSRKDARLANGSEVTKASPTRTTSAPASR